MQLFPTPQANPGRLIRTSLFLLMIFALAACSAPPTSAPVQNTAAAAPLLAAPQTTATTTAVPTAARPAPTETTSPTTTVIPTAVQPTATQAAAPACTTPAALTPAVTEGPYFKANSPERSSLLEAGVTGTPLTLTGYVLTSDCKPVAHALLEFWQANAQGQYDNSGYTLRGHQYTDANGRYQLLTINPGLYPGRTEHIHVKVQAPGGPVLTSQLFFPDVAGNRSDSIFNPALLVAYQGNAASGKADFNFIIQTK